LSRGDIVTANQRTSEIQGKINFGRDEEDEYDALLDWVELRSDMIGAGRDWDEMTATDSTALEQLLHYFDTYAAAQLLRYLCCRPSHSRAK